MKRITIVSTVAVVLLPAAFVIVRADTRGRQGWRGHGWHHPGPASYLAHDLNLNHAQKAKIRTFWEAERPAISGHIHDFLAENKEMDTMAAQGIPNQSKVQEIAGREATTIAALLVEKTRLQSTIYSTVLTPEQRAKTDELQNKWEARLDRVANHLGIQPEEK